METTFRYIRRSPFSTLEDLKEYPDLFESEVEWLRDFFADKFFKLPKEYKLNGHPKYLDGHVIGMDAASIATVWALQLDENVHTVLDMCCAPGMKFMMIHDTLTTKVVPRNTVLIGTDVSENRLRVCRNLLTKYGYSNLADEGLYMVSKQGDDKTLFSQYIRASLPKKKKSRLAKKQRVLETEPIFPNLFDRVLVDAECTHDGSERHEAKHEGFWTNHATDKNRVYYDTEEKILKLVDNQKNLIKKGFDLLRPGGLMVYSTCSLQSRQNEEVVEYLLSVCDGEAELAPLPFRLVGEGGLVPAKRVFGQCCLFEPAESGTSGQFIACIRKKSS